MNPRSVVLALLALAFSPMASAAESPGALVVEQPGGTPIAMPLEHTKVSIEVSAFVSRATVEQTFRNPFEKPVEAVYTFPLGDRAAVDDFEMQIGDRIVRGEIQRREAARQEYERARAEGYQAALLEQERPNVFTQSVANLRPGEAIVVRLRTVETLAYERGTYRLTFPLVVGHRYLPGGGRVPDAEKVSPPILKPGTRSGHDVEIAVSIDAGVPIGAIESPSHRVTVARADSRRAKVVLADADTIPNKDFLLRWSVASDHPAVGVLAHRDGVDGFFTFLVQPKGEISAIEAAPKEITFVVDTSGSMNGIPIEASKRLIQKALRELGPKDTFNLIRFAGDNTVWSKEPRPNTPADVEEAIAWLENLRGGGGTELLAAMQAAFARPMDPNRLRVVIFATDGFVGNDSEILGSIGEVLGDARIYCVGIGTSVNHYLLDRMADLGRGAYVFVRPDESADDALAAFRSWVTRPYLTDLEIDWGSLPVADTIPARPRDLFSGQTLSIVGRYLAAAAGEVVVRGKLGGVPWERRIKVELPDRALGHASLGSLWARRRVEGLMLENAAEVPDSIRAEVTALALEHRILTAYTSFLAVDISRVANPGGESMTVHQAIPLPEHVSFEGIFGKEGPDAFRANAIAARPEDDISDEELQLAKEESVRTREELSRLSSLGYLGGVTGGVAGGVAGGAPPPAPPPPAKFRSSFTASLPVTVHAEGPVMSPEPGLRYSVYRADAVAARGGTFDRDLGKEVAESFRVQFEASARLSDAALRVLADLAEDGALSPSAGKPALAALLAAQRKGGAISDDLRVHALATWALAEAAVRCKDEPWVARASKEAASHLATIAKGADDEGKRWARLALAVAAPATPRPDAPASAGSAEWKRLAAALQAVPSPASRIAGGEPFDRLCANARRGHLMAAAAGVR